MGSLAFFSNSKSRWIIWTSSRLGIAVLPLVFLVWSKSGGPPRSLSSPSQSPSRSSLPNLVWLTFDPLSPEFGARQEPLTSPKALAPSETAQDGLGQLDPWLISSRAELMMPFSCLDSMLQSLFCLVPWTGAKLGEPPSCIFSPFQGPDKAL